jgi:hypothetical protein
VQPVCTAAKWLMGDGAYTPPPPCFLKLYTFIHQLANRHLKINKLQIGKRQVTPLKMAFVAVIMEVFRGVATTQIHCAASHYIRPMFDYIIEPDGDIWRLKPVNNGIILLVANSLDELIDKLPAYFKKTHREPIQILVWGQTGRWVETITLQPRQGEITRQDYPTAKG